MFDTDVLYHEADDGSKACGTHLIHVSVDVAAGMGVSSIGDYWSTGCGKTRAE